ncbi:hypothetical protein ScPMuIL_009321 [Solemya velum]
MKVICARVGLEGNYTNHSGKRTCATQLYMAGVDEQEIMRRTGHRSEKSVRKYKSASPAILEKVASVLDPPQSSVERRALETDTHDELTDMCDTNDSCKRLKVEKALACGGTVTADKGKITSPNYPSNYNAGDYCEWIIDNNQPTVIEVEYDIEPSDGCAYDYLECAEESCRQRLALSRHQTTHRIMIIIWTAFGSLTPRSW